jgi:LEA14-like dessication related protein
VSIPLTHEGEIPVPAIPDVSLVSLQIDSLDFDRVETTLKVRVRNTNQFDLDLARLGLNLALGGQQVASTSVDSPGKLAPGQATTVAIPASFSPRAFGVGLFNLLRGTETGYGMTGFLELGTRFGPVTLPFDRQGNTGISR